jgi:hypothetical protein
MGERREDLSTADLASQQPKETPRPDRTDDADLERRDERARDDLERDDLAGGPAVTGDRGPDRAPDLEPDRERLQREDDRRGESAETEQEPPPAAVGEPAAEGAPDAGTSSTSAAGPLLAVEYAEGFRARWTDVQNGFVDAPRQAVEQADGLVAELMQHLARTFSEERGRLESQWDRGDEVSTDNLRTAFQRYRSFFERLLAT